MQAAIKLQQFNILLTDVYKCIQYIYIYINLYLYIYSILLLYVYMYIQMYIYRCTYTDVHIYSILKRHYPQQQSLAQVVSSRAQDFTKLSTAAFFGGLIGIKNREC